MRTVLFLIASTAFAQTALVKQGEQVFSKTCATGYCHGAGGSASGAPRVAARGFEQAYIQRVVSAGVADTPMPGFASRLSAADLRSVVAYVASLNGTSAENSPTQALTGDAAKGALLFREATRGFARCSTCHAVGGFGVPVAGPMGKVPATIAELKSLATPNVKTATIGQESMPAIVLSDGKQGALFYDLTSAPPVQRATQAGEVKFSNVGPWKHSTAGYSDAELTSVLAYLKAVKP